MLHTLIQAYFGKLAFFVGWDGDRHYELPEAITLLGRELTLIGVVGIAAMCVAILTPVHGDPPASGAATENRLVYFISPVSLTIGALPLVGAVCAVLGVGMRRRYGAPDYDDSRRPAE